MTNKFELDLGYHTKDEAGLGRRLSNLYPYSFIMDDIQLGSIEGFLQSLKFPDYMIQMDIVGLHGYVAFKTGQEGNNWKQNQLLYWNKVEYERSSKEYALLIERAYNHCFEQNELFRNSLMETSDHILTHNIGKYDQKDTTLTLYEYIYNMYRLRSRAFMEALT